LAHHNTIFAQIMKLISRHEFEALAQKYDHGNKLRKINRWSQFLALAMAQLTGRHSLRDLVSNLKAQARKLYHLGGWPGSTNRSPGPFTRPSSKLSFIGVNPWPPSTNSASRTSSIPWTPP